MATIDDLWPLISNLVFHLTLSAQSVIDFVVNLNNRNKLLEHLSHHQVSCHYADCTYCKYEADIVQPRIRQQSQPQTKASRDEVDCDTDEDYETPDSIS